jgi:hypothetical protein
MTEKVTCGFVVECVSVCSFTRKAWTGLWHLLDFWRDIIFGLFRIDK